MADPLLTGRKRQQKIYRHHTGYPGGLKELTFDTVLEKNPKRILINSLLGMLPKNTLRKRMIEENVKIYTEPYHGFGNILPQFMEPVAADINDMLELTKENAVLNFSSSGEIPEEFSDFPRDIDDSISAPLTIRKKTHTEDRNNFKLGIAIRKSYKENRRYKIHK
jgi:hypothetical protein